jgi:tetratricopeptide (TPR) repeat protein
MRQPKRAGGHCILLTLFLAANAAAAPADERATLGQELFDQGRALMEQQDYERACKKFEESARVERAGGTLLNLALCYELRGKTATAWAQFREALTLARREGRLDRQRFAEEHIAALVQRMSRVRIVVPAASRVPGLVVRRNTLVLPESAWDEALGVDPGPLLVEASAPGKKPFKASVEVGSTADSKSVVIPVLVSDVPRPQAPGTPPPPIPPAASDRGKTQRWLAYGTGALGLAALGVGSYFGIRAITRHNEAEELCPNLNRCNPRAFSLSERAATDGRVATYLIAGGAVFLVGGGVLFVTASSGPKAQAAVVTFTGGF